MTVALPFISYDSSALAKRDLITFMSINSTSCTASFPGVASRCDAHCHFCNGQPSSKNILYGLIRHWGLRPLFRKSYLKNIRVPITLVWGWTTFV